MKTTMYLKQLRYKHTISLLNRAAVLGDENAAGILVHLNKLERDTESLKQLLYEIDKDPDVDKMSVESYKKKAKHLDELIAIQRKQKLILRAIKLNNLSSVLYLIIPLLNKRQEKNRKNIGS